MLEILIENLREYQRMRALVGSNASRHAEWVNPMCETMTKRIIEQYGRELFPHGYAANGTLTILGDDLRTSVLIPVRTRSLKTQYALEDQRSNKRLGITEEQVIAKLCEDIFYEIKQEVNRLDVQGFSMVPFHILDGGMMIDPSTFEPMVAFYTRYANVPTEDLRQLVANL